MTRRIMIAGAGHSLTAAIAVALAGASFAVGQPDALPSMRRPYSPRPPRDDAARIKAAQAKRDRKNAKRAAHTGSAPAAPIDAAGEPTQQAGERAE